MRNSWKVILLAVVLLGCKDNKAAKITSEDSGSIVANNEPIEVGVPKTVRTVDWEEYKKQGYILTGKIGMYDESLNFTLCQSFANGITLVDIVQRTKDMMSNKESDDICDDGHFVKIRNNNTIINAFGAEVYEKSEDAIISFQNSKKENMEIFTIKNFMMDFAGEGELTGCNEEYPIIIKNNTTGKYERISTPRKDEYRTANNSSYYFLVKNDGIHEDVKSVSVNGDVITATIHIGYQDGDGTYELKIVKKNDSYTITSISEVTMMEMEHVED